MTTPPDPIDCLMIVDDSAFDQKVYERIAKRTGLIHELKQYLNAKDALAYLQDATTKMPDLILLDINMPQMDGFEFLSALIKSVDPARRPKIVMLTTSLNPSDEERAKSFGVVEDFLHKPLTQEQLKDICAMVAKLPG